jgi:hypothetical protein
VQVENTAQSSVGRKSEKELPARFSGGQGGTGPNSSTHSLGRVPAPMGATRVSESWHAVGIAFFGFLPSTPCTHGRAHRLFLILRASSLSSS